MQRLRATPKQYGGETVIRTPVELLFRLVRIACGRQTDIRTLSQTPSFRREEQGFLPKGRSIPSPGLPQNAYVQGVVATA